MKNFLKKYNNFLLLAFLLIVATVYSVVSVLSHNHFETFGWDLGFFDQIIWKASQGDFLAYSTIAHENLLADHFQVVLYFLASLYRVVPNVRAILVAQAFLVTLAAFPLYLLSQKVTKSFVFSLGLIIAYLLFLGTQWTILNEFHQTAFLPLFLSLFFYSIAYKKRKLYWFSILGIIATKEEYALLVAALGISAFLRYKDKKMAIATSALGVFSFFFLVYFLMPQLSVSGTYRHVDYGEAGYMPLDVVVKGVKDPLFIVKSMLVPKVKLETVFNSFFAFGFMPLFDPISLIPVLENFSSRFIYAGPQFTKWVNVNHHAAPLGMLMSAASVYGAVKIAKGRKTILTLLGFYLIMTSLAQDFVLHGPINSIVKPQLYQTLPWMEDNYAILRQAGKLPPSVPVAAQNSLVPHLSQREKIYLLPEIKDAEYIVADLHDGPNKYAPLNHQQMVEFVDELMMTGEFKVEKQQGKAYLLERIDR